jgi:NADPH:quinone reductase-like Zn-dependent oxidoreductase
MVVSIVSPPDQRLLADRKLRGRFFRMERDGLRLGKLADLIDRGTLQVRVKQLYPLLAAREAQDLSQTGQSHGKIVLRVG